MDNRTWSVSPQGLVINLYVDNWTIIDLDNDLVLVECSVFIWTKVDFFINNKQMVNPVLVGHIAMWKGRPV